MPYLSRLQQHPDLIKGIQRGIEREAIRLDQDGQFARDKHPTVLGSALTHPHITTDYSESLIELITSPQKRVSALFEQLHDIHAFVAQRVPDQSLWSQSMPCHLPEESQIPIAEYGSSNSSQLRHVYREGLAIRYGKKMQCIAGLHYNFSLPTEIWSLLDFEGNTPQEQQNNGYMALIRNFKRYSWLLMYLFGASPAVNASFLSEKQKSLLHASNDGQTYYAPYATSLRMSDLGYKNDAQSNLSSCFNELNTFSTQIYNAVTTSWKPYEEIGTKKGDKWIQINTNILQIENEFYATIRPKRSHGRGERPITALMKHGIEYIEVRCLDIDPFTPLGITEDSAKFLEAFLLFCAVHDSPYFPKGSCRISEENFNKVVNEGRRPDLQLTRQSEPILLKDWGLDLIKAIRPYSHLLAQAYEDQGFIRALDAQEAKLHDVALCPSHQVMAHLQHDTFHHVFKALSQDHAKDLRNTPLTPETMDRFTQQSLESIAQQKHIEQSDTVNFETYLAQFTAALRLH